MYQKKIITFLLKMNFITCIILLFFPFIIHFPEIIGILKSNPIYWLSGIQYNIIHGKYVINGTPKYDPNIGFTTQTLGYRSAADWLNFKIPWWNPYEGIGVPLAGEMQSAALFLPFILLLKLSNGVMYFHISLEIVGGISTFFLLRKLNLSTIASLTCALLFELNGTFAWQGNAIVNPIAFLPLFLLGIEEVYRDSKKMRGWIIIAISIAYSIYAGFPEVAYLDGLLALVWAVLRFIQSKEKFEFFKKIFLGGLLGLLLSTPIIIAFVDYLLAAYVGPNAGFNVYNHKPIYQLLQMFFPYSYGNINQFPISQISILFQSGYIGACLLFLASISTIGGFLGFKDKWLRFILTGFIFLSLLNNFGFKPVEYFYSLIPLIKNTAFVYFFMPSVEMAFIILAAFALDDLEKNNINFKKIILLSVIFVISIAIFSITTANNIFKKIIAFPHGVNAPLLSFLLSFFVIMGIALIYLKLNKFKKFIPVLLVLNYTILFIIPTFTYPISAKVDKTAIKYLKNKIGYYRIFSLGPISPNYGSYFQIASINFNDLPISKNYVNYVINNLIYKTQSFNNYLQNGNFVPDIPNEEIQINSLKHFIKNYEFLGVKYVIAPSQIDNFSHRNIVIKTASHGNIPLWLNNNQSVSGKIKISERNALNNFKIHKISVFIGNGMNSADGLLKVKLCDRYGCSYGAKSVKKSLDNNYFTIPLIKYLTIGNDESIKYEFIYTHATKPVAIWFWPTTNKLNQYIQKNNKKYEDKGFKIIFISVNKLNTKIVYKDKIMKIYKIPNPEPYFKAKDCVLRIISRTHLYAKCSKPSILVRRELFMKGWHALINGKPTVVYSYKNILERITLPKGSNLNIYFYFFPPYMTFALIVFFGVIVILLITIVIKIIMNKHKQNKHKGGLL